MKQPLKALIQNMVHALKYLKVVTPAGYVTILRMESNPRPDSRYTINVRQIGGRPIEMRAGTSDSSSLLAVYFDQYHVPPANLRKNPVILDLGCNAGHTTAHFAQLYPDSRIVSVEMDASNFTIARKNTSGFANCEIINKAISISDGIISYSPDASAVAYRIDADKKTSDASDINVASITMNSLCAALNEDVIDYVKMDIEGEEVRIFDSDTAGLAWLDRVQSLNIEVHTGSGALEKIISVLEARGFKAWKDQHHWSAVLAEKKQN